VTVFKHAFRASIRRAYAPIEGGQSLDEAKSGKSEASAIKGANAVVGRSAAGRTKAAKKKK
jgi:hypothetical protein